MKFFLITIITIFITFSLNPVFKKIGQKRPAKFHIHHSVPGIILFAIGILTGGKVIAAMGLGIYLGHALEEMYFNKTNFIKAFFIFVTR